MRNLRRIFLIIAVLGIAALAVIYSLQGLPSPVAKALRDADSFELLSLDPQHGLQDADFHGYKILGRTQITDTATRQLLYDALQTGASWNSPFAMKCFDPRHAIRVRSKGIITDLLICFECLQVEVHSDAAPETKFIVNRKPEPLFDQVLRDASVPLAPKADSNSD
jgi:hypothetical protein